MSEYVRTVKIHVEVDTNKQTYVLDLADIGVGEMERSVNRFINEHGFWAMAVGR